MTFLGRFSPSTPARKFYDFDSCASGKLGSRLFVTLTVVTEVVVLTSNLSKTVIKLRNGRLVAVE